MNLLEKPSFLLVLNEETPVMACLAPKQRFRHLAGIRAHCFDSRTTGHRVKKGQLLLRVQSSDFAGAFSDYRKAVNDERLARFQFERAKILYEKGAIAKGALETFENAEQDAQVRLNYFDEPKNPCLPGGAYANNEAFCKGTPNSTPKWMAFKTQLVGICFSSSSSSVCPSTGNLDAPFYSSPLFQWTWNDNNNANLAYGPLEGGVYDVVWAETASTGPSVPGSGTGGITITSVNGVQLNPVPSTQISTTASGLAYSRALRAKMSETSRPC